MLEPIVTSVLAGVALPDRDMILLVRHMEQAQWVLPTAALQPGETVQQAAQRAVRETTGVTVALTNLVGIYTDIAANTLTFVFTAYAAPDRVRPGASVEAFQWTMLTQAETLADASLRPVLADLRRGIRFPLGVLVER